MILTHVFNHLGDPRFPKIGIVSVILTLDLEGVAVQVDEIGEGRENVKWVASYHDHFVRREWFRPWYILRIVSLAHPHSV